MCASNVDPRIENPLKQTQALHKLINDASIFITLLGSWYV